MLCFTTGHTIPINLELPLNMPRWIDEPIQHHAYSTVIGHQIWISFNTYIYGEKDRNNFFVFDTKTHEMTDLTCKLPAIPNFSTSNVASSEDKLYIFMKKIIRHITGPEPECNHKIFKFDTKSLTYTFLFNLSSRNLLGPPQIIGNFMYCLENGPRYIPAGPSFVRRIEVHKVIKIDLTGRNAVKSIELSPRHGEQYRQMFAKNSQLYLLSYFENKLVVSTIDNDNPIIPLTKIQHDISVPITKWFNDSVIRKSYPNGPTLFLNTFDFNIHQWNRQAIENPSNRFFKFEFKSAELIDDTLFAVAISTPCHDPDKNNCVVKVIEYELKPKLSSICLLRLVDHLLSDSDNEKVDRVLESLPIPMRRKLSNMLEWRISG